MRVSDVINIEGGEQIQLAVSAVAAQTAALEDGVYDVTCDVDCYLKVATDASGVTTSTGYLLYAGNTVSIAIGANKKLGAIAGGSGTLRLHKVGQ